MTFRRFLAYATEERTVVPNPPAELAAAVRGGLDHAPDRASRAWTIAWLAWIGSFFALELPPLLRGRPQDTLSDHVWAWAGVAKHPGPPRPVRLRRFVLLAACAWVCAHFLSGDEF